MLQGEYRVIKPSFEAVASFWFRCSAAPLVSDESCDVSWNSYPG